MLGRNAPITLDHWLEGAQKDHALVLKAEVQPESVMAGSCRQLPSFLAADC